MAGLMAHRAPWWRRSLGSGQPGGDRVTEALRSEQALRDSETRFRLAFDHGPVPMALIGLDGGYQRVNLAMCSFVGYSAEELLARNVADVTHPDDLAADTAAMVDLVAGERSTYSVDKRYRTAGGATVWGAKSATVVRREDGTPVHFISQILDITERKLQEQELDQERRRREEAESIGRVGFWEYDLVSDKLTCSSGLYKLWGMDAGALDPEDRAATFPTHPDDRDVLQVELAACASTGAPFSVRFRINRVSDGVLRWVNTQGAARWQDGRIVRIGGAATDVTEQVQAELDAVAATAFQQAVFTASPDTIAVWDLESSSIVWTNRSLPEQLGYGAEESAVIDTNLAEHLVLADDLPGLLASVEAARTAQDDAVIHVDFRMRHRDGTDRWFSRRTAPLRRDKHGLVSQLVGITRDITARKRTEEALLESESLFRQFADSVDVAFVLRSTRPAGFLYVSPAYQKIFGYDPMAVGESPDQTMECVHADDRDRFRRDYWTPALAGLPARLEYRIVRPDGEVRWVRCTATPVRDPGGALDRSASVVEDITVSRLAEGALLAARTAEKANAAKNEFLSRMSHELRTPLNAVLGFAQLLELDDLTTEQHHALQHVIRGGRHLVGLIDDVLDISRIENDHLGMSLELVLVDQLLTDTVELMTPQADAANIVLNYRSGSAVQAVQADHRRLRQVVLNLLSNAIKYNRPGGRVDVTCTSIGDSVLDIVVRDTGRGIAAELLPRLFTPFDRLDAHSTGIEGTGVGLALSQRLMTLMNGTLTASSTLGSGSTFTASLPLATAHPADPAVLSVSPAPPPPPLGGPDRTLLYIEDNISNVALMERLLTHRPRWKMIVAGHGTLGLELAAAVSPDLVLLDLHLPDMNGLDILRSLHADPITEDLVVVVISADANPHRIDRMLTAGAHAYLTKPLDVTEVLHLLDTVSPRPGRLG